MAYTGVGKVVVVVVAVEKDGLGDTELSPGISPHPVSNGSHA